MLRGNKNGFREDDPLLEKQLEKRSKGCKCCCSLRGACITMAILGVLFLIIGGVANTVSVCVCVCVVLCASRV